jgi:hypothetical protein
MRLLQALMLLAPAVAAVPLAPCALPTTYNWTSTGPLAENTARGGALQDLTHVVYKGKNLVYATTHDSTSTWGTVVFDLFTDWAQMPTLKKTPAPSMTAGSLFYFRPKDIWVMAYQWGASNDAFFYRTSKDPSSATGWSAEQTLFSGTVDNTAAGPMTVAIIGDARNMHLFFTASNGVIYKASMPAKNFPGSFGAASTAVLKDQQRLLFEGPQVYSLSDSQYLMTVVAIGYEGRFIRSFTAPSLDGPWAVQAGDEARPFAGKANSGATWTNDVDVGELIRTDPDQRMRVDACKLQLLYQGRPPNPPDFSPIRYRPALLTLKK